MNIKEFAPILKVLLNAQQAQNERAQASGLGPDQLVFTRNDYYVARAELVGELIKGVIHAVTKEEAA